MSVTVSDGGGGTSDPQDVTVNLQVPVAGILTDSGQALGNEISVAVTLGDLDGDGDLDAFVANVYNAPNRVLLNDGLGNFSDSGQSLGNGSSYDVSLADIDGDGDLDAFVANRSTASDRVWLNDGTGTFQRQRVVIRSVRQFERCAWRSRWRWRSRCLCRQGCL